jgi:anti-sigma regulatory factor (Ser/Thr protein kinase)
MPAAPLVPGSVKISPGDPAAGKITFPRRPDEVPAARRFVRTALAGHPGSQDAELLACELITNAVQHAADAAEVTVRVTCHDRVRVEVIDDGRIGLPHWRESSGWDEGGRGFHLVNEIAYRWGFHREPNGTCVWFELAP